VLGLLKLGQVEDGDDVNFDEKTLDFGGLEIDRVEGGAFARFQGLYKLLLQKNKLTKLPKRPFHKDKSDKNVISKLTFLDISNNLLDGSSLARLRTWRMTNLVALRLGGNQLKEFPSCVFESCPNLCALVLNDNKLTSIKFTTPLPKLNTLILSNNEFSDLGDDVGFENINGLKKLSASKNNLTQFPAVGCCKDLAEVRLSGNKISSFFRNDGPDGENISQLENHVKMAVVDLSNNAFETMDSLKPLSAVAKSIIHLSLRGNVVQTNGFENIPAFVAELARDTLQQVVRMKTIDSKTLAFWGVDLPRQDQPLVDRDSKPLVAKRKREELPETDDGVDLKPKVVAEEAPVIEENVGPVGSGVEAVVITSKKKKVKKDKKKKKKKKGDLETISKKTWDTVKVVEKW